MADGDSQNEEPKKQEKQLDADTKIAINAYLAETIAVWAKIVGVANILLVITSLAWLLFVLPNKASLEATAIMKVRIDEQTSELSKKLVDLQTDYGRTLERAAQFQKGSDRVEKLMSEVETEIGNLNKKLTTLNTAIAIAEKSDPAKAAIVLAELEKSPKIEDLFERTEAIGKQLDSVEVRLKGIEPRLKTLEDSAVRAGSVLSLINRIDGSVSLTADANGDVRSWPYGGENIRQQWIVTPH